MFYSRLFRSLDDLEPFARKRGVQIALENWDLQTFEIIEKVLKRYNPEYLGICYDSGHGNIFEGVIDVLDRIKERLIVVHLHDNDGKDDLHDLIFSGTLDGNRLARIIAQSSYNKCVSMEVNMNCFGSDDQKAFLKKAFMTGKVFQKMVEDAA